MNVQPADTQRDWALDGIAFAMAAEHVAVPVEFAVQLVLEENAQASLLSQSVWAVRLAQMAADEDTHVAA